MQRERTQEMMLGKDSIRRQGRKGSQKLLAGHRRRGGRIAFAIFRKLVALLLLHSTAHGGQKWSPDFPYMALVPFVTFWPGAEILSFS